MGERANERECEDVHVSLGTREAQEPGVGEDRCFAYGSTRHAGAGAGVGTVRCTMQQARALVLETQASTGTCSRIAHTSVGREPSPGHWRILRAKKLTIEDGVLNAEH